MSHSIACSYGSKIRAIAVLSGALLSGCAGGTAPVAYYGEHGVGDATLPFASGEALRDHWVTTNGCTPQTAKTTTSGSGTHVVTNYAGCSAGHPVEWVAFDGPHEPLATDRGQNTPWTPAAVWTFWSQFF
jgi:poly(3-hydroxybutyrate) depolymerase